MSVKLIAHRGESETAPENTIEAFALAWARGAVAIEGDFHLTRDEEIICMHDSNTKRTCGIDAEISSLTLAEIKKLDAGRWKGDSWKYTRVPTLKEVLDTMPPFGEIYIELKSIGKIVPRMREIFASGSWTPKQLSFIAFDEATIRAVKELFPEHSAYWLTVNSPDKNTGVIRFTPESLAEKLKSLKVDGVDICCNEFINADYVKAVRKAGLSFHVWTVDDAATASRMASFGVDSITSNRPYAMSHEMV